MLCLPDEFLALLANLLFQFVQQHGVVLADGVHQRREQQITRGLRSGQKSSYQVAGTPAFPLLARQTRRIKKGALRLLAIQQALLE